MENQRRQMNQVKTLEGNSINSWEMGPRYYEWTAVYQAAPWEAAVRILFAEAKKRLASHNNSAGSLQ